MSNQNQVLLVDGIKSIAIHNDVARVQFMRLDNQDQSENAVRILIPIPQIQAIADALHQLSASFQRPAPVVGQPEKAAGQPGKTADQPEKATGQPEKAAGQPGKTAGQPGKTTGQPGKTVGQPEKAATATEEARKPILPKPKY